MQIRICLEKIYLVLNHWINSITQWLMKVSRIILRNYLAFKNRINQTTRRKRKLRGSSYLHHRLTLILAWLKLRVTRLKKKWSTKQYKNSKRQVCYFKKSKRGVKIKEAFHILKIVFRRLLLLLCLNKAMTKVEFRLLILLEE